MDVMRDMITNPNKNSNDNERFFYFLLLHIGIENKGINLSTVARIMATLEKEFKDNPNNQELPLAE